MANFVVKFHQKSIIFALIWLVFTVFLTEIIISYFNNTVREMSQRESFSHHDQCPVFRNMIYAW